MLCVLGPPCAGKTTLAQELAKETGLPHVIASAELQAVDGTDLSRDQKQVAVIMSRLRKPDCMKGFVLDNFPRNVAQAKALEEALQHYFRRGVSHVIDVEAPIKVLESRAANRLVDRGTGLPAFFRRASSSERSENDDGQFSVKLNMRKKSQRFHRQYSALEQTNVRRIDDVPERVQHRFQRHFENIAALRQFYADKNFIRVDGAQSKDDVLRQACSDIFGAGRKHQATSHEKGIEGSEIGSVGVAQDCLEKAEARYNEAWNSFQLFKREVASQSNWINTEKSECCGCNTKSRTYVGGDPPAMWAGSDVALEQSLKGCKNSLRKARQIYARQRYGEMNLLLAWCFVECCTATKDIEDVQKRYNDVSGRVSRMQNAFSAELAKTVTQTTTIYCAQHEPPEPSIAGSL